MPSKCSNEDFVQAWTESKSRSEVAAKTGLSVKTVASKALHLRKKGVRLKHFPCAVLRTPPLDIPRLNAIVAACSCTHPTENP